MSERDPDPKSLRDAFASLEPPASPASPCPADEEIWAASRGELPPARTRQLLAHSLECGNCKQSWMAASALAAEAALPSEPPQESKPGTVISFQARRHRTLKVLGAMAATLVIMILLTTVLNRHEDVVAPATLSEDIRTDLWRVGESHPLAAGDRLRTGDRIYLTLESDVPVHLYVINEDQAGESAALFPISGAQWTNPLPAGEAHRLPGERGWQYDSWEVSSPGGQESFMIVAALEPLPGLESALALLDPAAPQDQHVRGGATADPGAGIDPAQARAELARVLESLRDGSQDQSVMVREIVLENPGLPGS